MPQYEVTYPIPPRGLATNFSESDTPIAFATRFRNRFINQTGAAEKRPGMTQLGDTITGSPDLTNIHELVEVGGSAKLMASGQGRIYRLDGTTWTEVYASADSSQILYSVQMGERLIFVNGIDRPFFTTDTSAFSELQPLIEQGQATTGTSAKALRDSNIANWIIDTDVVENDLVYYPGRNAYGLVTAVVSAEVRHTAVSALTFGLGATNSGEAASGDDYRIYDLVELNIIPSDIGLDNIAVAGSGTSGPQIRVSGVDFSKTEVRIGDYVYNSTRAQVSKISSVSANLSLDPFIIPQNPGDSLVFLKSAMPIASQAHVHYGRLYLLDARDKTKIRISGANDPQDFTTDAATLESNSFNFGTLQSQGDTLLAMGSYQQFFVMLGRRFTYLFQGTNPVRSSAASTDFDFSPVGLFPHGGMSERSVATIGNDLVFVASDGVMSVTQTQDFSTLNRTNLSEPIRNTLRSELNAAASRDIQIFHYPQRSWLLVKVGSNVYCYNYSAFINSQGPNYGGIPAGQANQGQGSWSLFDGKFAAQSCFFVRSDNTLIAAGTGGKVYRFDQSATDDGQTIVTEFRTGWLTLEETKGSFGSVRRKHGLYIKPILEAGGPMNFLFSCEAPFSGDNTDEVEISTCGGATPIGLYAVGDAIGGGSAVVNDKYPFRWQGEVVRITAETSSQTTPDILSRYTLYAVMRGRE